MVPRPAVASPGVRDEPPGARRCGAAPLEGRTCSDDGGSAWVFAFALGFAFRAEPPTPTRSPEPLREVAAGFRVDSICRCFETPSVRHSLADWRSEPTFFGIPARFFPKDGSVRQVGQVGCPMAALFAFGAKLGDFLRAKEVTLSFHLLQAVGRLKENT